MGERFKYFNFALCPYSPMYSLGMDSTVSLLIKGMRIKNRMRNEEGGAKQEVGAFPTWEYDPLIRIHISSGQYDQAGNETE